MAAVVLVLAADRRLCGDVRLWRSLEPTLEKLPQRRTRLELGIVQDRLGLSELRDAPAGRSRVILIGNSRAIHGFNLKGHRTDDLAIAHVTHAAITPFSMRSFAEEAASHRPAVFVMMLSELDTHRPIRITPTASFGSLPAVWDLARATGPAYLFRNRGDIERLVVGSVLEAYLYRDVLELAWLDGLRSFATEKQPKQARRRPRRRKSRFPPPRDPTAEPEPRLAVGLDELLAGLPRPMPRRYPTHVLNLIHEIRPGPHVAEETTLIERTVELLRGRGIEVLIVEGPLNPLAFPLYDRATTRAEFLAFVERLVQEHGVHFLSLEESGPYSERDFRDLLHMQFAAGSRLARLTLERTRQLLP